MSNLILALLSSVPILHLSVRSALPEDPSTSLPKAADILAKLEADGGTPEARAKAKNLVVRGKIEIEGMPGEGRMEQIYAGTDRVRWNSWLPCWTEGMQGTQGTNGVFSWSSDPMSMSIREGDDQGAVRRQFAVARRAPWKSIYARAETVAKVKIDGREAFEIRMIPAKGDPETWIVDAVTSRLICSDHSLPDPLGGTIPVWSWPSDWKEFEGIRYPHRTKVQLGIGGPAQPEAAGLVYTVASIEHPAEIAPERVAPPNEALEAYKDPSKRTKPAPTKSGEFVKTSVEAQPVASVRVKIPGNEVAQHLSMIFPEVMGYLLSIGADMAGPPFTRYHDMSEAKSGGTIEIEAGFPVKKKIEGKGRIQASELPGGETAVTWHIGPYDELSKGHDMLAAWMKGEKLAARGGPWEIYWTDPGMEPDPKKYRTQILWPVQPVKDGK